MDELNFINNSNDANNSQVVIFQQNNSLPDGLEVAVHLISLSKGSTASVPVAADVEFHVAVITPAITVNGGVMKIEEISTPAVLMKAGQTASISGDSDSGYVISVEG
ncbi:hypothetical protein [Mucilaginibacter sp. OK098]|uniref:hypothetical protein n=1 Tax=Mucilaginibacter sp. OK098 TaxID=1855297 RepID=UPI00090FCA94|nr:hypothetical protein [Mucilaginibacter sp. OK098]SHM27102.1 hypothetical protein SAMN05216524_1011366 [Mucilaginibacter sp. OK098]